jgi:hypothetical protein
MSRTIQIDSQKYNKSRKATVRGVDVEVSPSPYDVPYAVAVDYFSGWGVVTIRFKYLADEVTVQVPTRTSALSLEIGKNSRRIYGIEVILSAIDGISPGLTERVSSAIGAALDDLAGEVLTSHRSFNYQVIRSIVENIEHEVFGSLA